MQQAAEVVTGSRRTTTSRVTSLMTEAATAAGVAEAGATGTSAQSRTQLPVLALRASAAIVVGGPANDARMMGVGPQQFQMQENQSSQHDVFRHM